MVNKKREAFEKWVLREWNDYDIGRDSDGYHDRDLEICWNTWQSACEWCCEFIFKEPSD